MQVGRAPTSTLQGQEGLSVWRNLEQNRNPATVPAGTVRKVFRLKIHRKCEVSDGRCAGSLLGFRRAPMVQRCYRYEVTKILQ